MSLERLHDLLVKLGPIPAPTPREVAELLWLATRLPSQDPQLPTVTTSQKDSWQAPDERGSSDRETPGSPTPKSEPAVPVYAPAAAPRSADTQLFAARSTRLAADPPLPHRLELLRALRSLKRRVPSGHHREIDEEATLDDLASRSIPTRRAPLLPVLRPTRERWLDVVLVLDGHPTSLLLWSPQAREVRNILVHLGAFRDVRLRYLHIRTDGTPGLSPDPDPHPDRLRDVSEIRDPSGRRLVLILTDAVAPHWSSTPVRDAMRLWAAAGPLAVVQALPEALWRRTALPTVPASLRRAPRSAANADLAYRGRRRSSRELTAGAIPVPVLGLEAEWLKPWSELVAGSGAEATDAAVTLLSADTGPARPTDDDRSPQRRLEDFHATASPDAFRLLTLLSAVPLSMATMRAIQAAMLPGTTPSVLAEVVFSGLIRPQPSPPDACVALADRPHDFLPGVRATLLKSLRSHELDLVLYQVARYAERGGEGRAGRISGLIPDHAGNAELPTDGIPWALLREKALIRAGLAQPAQQAQPVDPGPGERTIRSTSAPYGLVELITYADFSDVYLGEDPSGRQAVVKVLPAAPDLRPGSPDATALSGFLHVEAEALRRMGGTYAPPLLGVDPRDPAAWLAMGHIVSLGSGGSAPNLLTSPWWQYGPADDFRALYCLALALAHALERAHTAGIVHGNLSPHAVLLVPDSVMLISWVYAQFDGQPHPFPQYRRRASGYLPPEGYAHDIPLDPSFDVFGLGMLLFREATRDSLRPVNMSDVSQVPDDIGALSALIRLCLDPDPARRPSARMLIKALMDLTPWQSPRVSTIGIPLAESLLRGPDSEDEPPYVPRHFDPRLRHVLRRAQDGASQLLVLTGARGAGKTRSAWEAIRQLPSDWHVWEPSSASEFEAGLRSVGPRTVVWLDSVDRLMAPDVSREVRQRLVSLIVHLRDDVSCAPVVIIAAMQRDRVPLELQYVLGPADLIDVPERLSAAEERARRLDESLVRVTANRRSGVGVVVGNLVLTADDLVRGATSISVRRRGRTSAAEVHSTQPRHGVALLSILDPDWFEGASALIPDFSSKVALGQQLMASTFTGQHPQGLHIACSVVKPADSTSQEMLLEFARENPLAREIRHAEMSGAPLIDAAGNLVGLVTSALPAATDSGSLFLAVPASGLRQLLGDAGVSVPGRHPLLPRRGDSRAVLVGAGPVLDSFAAAVLERDGEPTFAPEGLTTVLSPARPADLLDPLRQAALDARDVLLFYFAGHGLVDQRGQLRLVLASGDEISTQAINEILLRSRAQRRLVIADCPEARRWPAPATGGIVFIGATGGDAAQPTAFTEALVDVLRNGVVHSYAPVLDLQLVHSELRRRLSAQGVIFPFLVRSSDVDIALAPNRAPRTGGSRAGDVHPL